MHANSKMFYFIGAFKVPLIDLQTIRKVCLIGKGSFGEVHLVEVKNEKYAAKYLDPTVVDEEDFMNEVQMLNKISHPNIVNLKGFLQDDLVLVLDRAVLSFQTLLNIPRHNDVTNLAEFLRVVKKDATVYLNLPHVSLSIGKQVTSAVVYLHSKKIAHRDLKPSNVLVR